MEMNWIEMGAERMSANSKIYWEQNAKQAEKIIFITPAIRYNLCCSRTLSTG